MRYGRVLREKMARTRIGERSGSRMVVVLIRVRKGVPGAVVEVRLDLLIGRESGRASRAHGGWREVIALADVQQQRCDGGRYFGEVAVDARAVVRHGRVDKTGAGGAVGERAAQAETDDRDAPIAPGLRAQLDRGVTNAGQCIVVIER